MEIPLLIAYLFMCGFAVFIAINYENLCLKHLALQNKYIELSEEHAALMDEKIEGLQQSVNQISEFDL